MKTYTVNVSVQFTLHLYKSTQHTDNCRERKAHLNYYYKLYKRNDKQITEDSVTGLFIGMLTQK